MLASSVLSAPASTASARSSTAVTLPMNSSGTRGIVRMQRLGLGRALGDWTSGMSLFGSRTGRAQGQLSARAAATEAAGASSSYSSSSATAAAPRVVVLGGGFGGLYAAVRLDQLYWPRGKKPQVTLVDQADRFVFKPLLYELINGTAAVEEVAPPFDQLLAPYPVRFVQAQVSSVEPSSSDPAAAGTVTLADGTVLPYDYLVVALGSQPDSRGVPGVREWAVPFSGLDDALRVKGTLDLLADSGAGGSVVVVGGGYAGVELAAVIGERLQARGGGGGGVTVRVLTPGSHILEGCPEGQRAAAAKVLADVGVQVVTGARVRGLSAPSSSTPSYDDPSSSASASLPTACTVSYSLAEGGGEGSLAADLVVWTAGSSPSTREARQGFPFPTTERGAITTEPSLRVSGSDTVFALGDVAVASPSAPAPDHHTEQQLPATAQVAFQQADYAAWNVWASINGRPLLPFRYQHLGSMMALGQLNAAVALPIPFPAPLADALRTSALGPLLSAAGVRLGSGEAASAASDPASGAAGGGVVGSDSGVTLEGPLAALMRRGAYLYRQPTNEQRLSVAASWVKLGLEAAASIAGGRSR